MLRIPALLLAATFALPVNAEPCEPYQIGKLVDFYVDWVWLKGEPIIALDPNGKLIVSEHSEVLISFANEDYVLNLESMRQHVSGDSAEIINHINANLASWIGPVETAMQKYGTDLIAGATVDNDIWFGTSTPDGCVGYYIPAVPVEWLESHSPVPK